MRNLIPGLALASVLGAVCAACSTPAASCAPTLESPWIRAALPGTTMLAGYAVVRNDCPSPVTIVGAEGDDFAAVTLHATVDEGGISRMREAGSMRVAANGSLAFAPGASHLMLSAPARPMPEGTRTTVRLVLADGRRVAAPFEVMRDAPETR
jgi:copper(I)-binding protein